MTLPTPSLLIDAAVVNRNHARLLDYVQKHDFSLRAHTKTHKLKKLGAKQSATSSAGLTVAKVGEAEVMAEVCNDLLLAYPVVDIPRATRAAELAKRCTLRVAVDSETAIQTLSDAANAAGSEFGILIDMDVGVGRTGVQTPQASVELAQIVADTPRVRLDGLFIYPGHVGGPPERQAELLATVNAKVNAAIDLWHAAGLDAAIVSTGSTPSAYQSHHVEAATEIRPGTYIYNDMNTVRGGYCAIDDCAARLGCTVVSTAVPGQVVIDAGSKTLTMDPSINGQDDGYGFIVEYPDARIVKLTEEHGQVDVSKSVQNNHAHGKVPALGERVHIIPNHICPCSNLQNEVWWLDREVSDEPQRLTVDARGALV